MIVGVKKPEDSGFISIINKLVATELNVQITQGEI